MAGLDKRAVVRETNTLDPVRRRKPLVVKLEVGGKMVRIKVKGERRWYAVGYADLYRMGCSIRSVELRAEKTAAKQARKEAAGG